jgi:hypothetical protein
MKRNTHQEKRIRQKRINKNNTPKHPSNTHKTRRNRKYNPNKLVPRIRENINKLAATLDIKDVATQFDEQKVEEDDEGRAGGALSENLGSEAGSVETCVQACEEDVGYDCHGYRVNGVE